VVLLGGTGGWFFYEVAGPRLGNQNELAGLAAPVALDFENPAHLDSLLSVLATAFAQRPANAGIAIGVTRNGRHHVAYRGVLAKDDSTALVGDSTLFELGSLTKTFTGIALAQAVVQGRAELDQPIAALLPDSSAVSVSIRSITLGTLATHTAGLPSDPPSVSLISRLFRKHPFGSVTETDAFESLEALGVGAEPSREYAYSNYGFMLLGHLLEGVTGTGYAGLVEQGIAAPLGMVNTWVKPPVAQLRHLATGHRVGRPVEHWYDMPLPGASGVVSTVPDLLRYLDAHLRADTTALSRSVQLAMQPRVRASESVEAGLGWHIYTVPDVPRVIYHNGSMMGFRSYIGMAPELDLGIVVLGNSRDPTIGAIGRLIMRTLSGNED
jgi:CubicO group peptidase (beta-lactamase class C family)